MFDEVMDYLGSALDKPGRAVRGLLSGRAEEGLAAIPFSDSLGLTDPSRAVSGKDLARDWFGLDPGSLEGRGAGFGLDMALDPTTYVGGFLGRLGGKAIGRGLETAAAARGPGFATKAEDLARMAAGTPDATGQVGRRLSEILGMPDRGAGVLSEIHPGSQILGAGAEGIAFGTPGGMVTRVGRSPVEALGRPVSDDVLQATRSVDYPRSAAFNQRVEQLPLAAPAGQAAPGDLLERLKGQGLGFSDPNPGNWGMHGGRPTVIDPGAVSVGPDFAGGFGQSLAAREPDKVTKFLLDVLGGRPAMQRAMASGRAAPRYSQGFGLAGTAAGSSLGAY